MQNRLKLQFSDTHFSKFSPTFLLALATYFSKKIACKIGAALVSPTRLRRDKWRTRQNGLPDGKDSNQHLEAARDHVVSNLNKNIFKFCQNLTAWEFFPEL